jgi:hypothetical protein
LPGGITGNANHFFAWAPLGFIASSADCKPPLQTGTRANLLVFGDLSF